MNKISSELLEEIRRLYWDEGLSQKEVGKRIGVSHSAICYQLKKHFGSRTISESLIGKKQPFETVKKRSDSIRQRTQEKLKEGTKGRILTGWSQNYIAVRVPNHPFATKDGYVMEHRLVMENHIGRFLERDEQVHHINGDTKDNRIENLQIISPEEHTRMHVKERIENGTFHNYIPLSKEEIIKVVKQGGTTKEMADSLNIHHTTFFRKIKQLNLSEWYKNWRNAQ